MNEMILAINPGSTSTKIGIFKRTECLEEIVIRHSSDVISSFNSVYDQYEFRKDLVVSSLEEKGYKVQDFAAIVGRGGMLKPIPSGTYLVNEAMLEWVKKAPRGEHASNLGCVIARIIADEIGVNAYIVDPVAVDEMADIARITGMPQFERDSLFHALNQKAVAKRYAKAKGIAYDSLNLIVAHLGGGISVGVHEKGLVVDVNNALDGDGPMSPERSGTVPLGKLYKAIFNNEYTLEEIKKMNYGQGGLVAHLNSNDGREIGKMIDAGDKKAELVYGALAYQVAKEIGSAAAVLSGKVDAIIITGGLAYDQRLVSWIKDRVGFITDIEVYPGEDELLALVEGTLRVLDGEEEPQIYI